MLQNANLAIVGRQLTLVPYRPEHVPRYHKWMKSPYLQEMTGSEPLTLEEEYEMQKSWRQDQDKCTFIILSGTQDIHNSQRMIGDVNFYLNNPHNPKEAELEVMIAEDQYSGKGMATEALRLMMQYAVDQVGVTEFVVRIKETNLASIHIFESKFGFKETERSRAFKEVTLRRQVSQQLVAELDQWARENSKHMVY